MSSLICKVIPFFVNLWKICQASHFCKNDHPSGFIANNNSKSVKYDHPGECSPEKDCL